MIVPIIFLSQIVVIFSMLIFEGLCIKPQLKQKMILVKNVGQVFTKGLFVIKSDIYTLIFLKNLSMRIEGEEFGFNIDFFTNIKFLKYYATLDYMNLYYEHFKIQITKHMIDLSALSTVKIEFRLKRPNCYYKINQKTKTIEVGKYKLKLKILGECNLNFYNREDNFIFLLEFKQCKIMFNKEFDLISNAELKSIKQKYFGFFDTSCWAYMPRFDVKNQLQEDYQKNLLNDKNKAIVLPSRHYQKNNNLTSSIEIKSNSYISLKKLGITQLVEVKKYSQKIVITDLLSNITYYIFFNKRADSNLMCYWGDLGICFDKNINIRIEVFNKFIENSIFNKPLLFINNSMVKFNIDIDLFNVLDNIQRIIMHGVNFKFDKLLYSINYKFLSPLLVYKLANCLISYIYYQNKINILNKKSVINLLFMGLKYALKNFDKQKVMFLKKVLPIIKDKDLYKIVFKKTILKQKLDTYEYLLTQIIGIKLKGDKFCLKPSKNYTIRADVWIRNKTVSILIKKDWQVLKINDLSLSGIDYFKLDFQNLIEFKFE